MNSTLERIQRILRDVLDVPELEVTERTVAADVAGWDSLAHVSLMFSIEHEFGIAFTDDELSGFRDLGDLAEVVERKSAARSN